MLVPVTTDASQRTVKVYGVLVEQVQRLDGVTRYRLRSQDGEAFSMTEALLLRLRRRLLPAAPAS